MRGLQEKWEKGKKRERCQVPSCKVRKNGVQYPIIVYIPPKTRKRVNIYELYQNRYYFRRQRAAGR